MYIIELTRIRSHDIGMQAQKIFLFCMLPYKTNALTDDS